MSSLNTNVIELAARPGTAHLGMPIFDRLLPDWETHQVTDGRHEPHIRAGELAVVDTSDKNFVSGELYLVQFKTQVLVMQVCQYTEGMYFHPLNRPRTFAGVDRRIASGERLYVSDGPLRPECLPGRLLGRVIGVYHEIAQAA